MMIGMSGEITVPMQMTEYGFKYFSDWFAEIEKHEEMRDAQRVLSRHFPAKR
jgi:hypothetical protein